MGKKKEKKKDRKVIRGYAIDISSVLQDLKHSRMEDIHSDTDAAYGAPEEVMQEWSKETITISKKEFMDKSAHAALSYMKEMDAPISIYMAVPRLLTVITMALFGETEEEDYDDGQGKADKLDQ